MQVPYMLIGGMANAIWGVPRATVDVDVAVGVAEPDIAGTVQKLGELFRIVPADPVEFVLASRVLPMDTPDGVRLDVIFGMTPMEDEAIRRAVVRRIGGQAVRVCTPEDLVIFKLGSDRERDGQDAEEIVKRNARTLDRIYLDPKIKTLSEGLARPDILSTYLAWLK